MAGNAGRRGDGRLTHELDPHDLGPQDACGVFGVWAPGEDVAKLTYYGLYALQHRGQESAGIAVSNGRQILVYKDMGLVSQVFDESTLEALKGHQDDVMLCSHDGDFAPQLGALDDGRRLGLLALREFVSGQLTALGIPLFDLEDDVAAFNAVLPRVRVIPLADFDPEQFLR